MRFNYFIDESERSQAPFFSTTILNLVFGAMLITVAVLFLAWPKKDLYYYVKFGEVPLVFMAVSVAILLTIAYINLRCGTGELVRDDFPYRLVPKKSLTHEERHGFMGYAFVAMVLFTLFLLLLFFPFLAMAAAIAITPLIDVVRSAVIIFAVALCCRLTGFMLFLIYGKGAKMGQLLSRGFYFLFIFATAPFAPQINPLMQIYTMGEGGGSDRFLIALAAVIALLTLTNLGLHRRRSRQEAIP
jgi:hypothetical protein